MRLFVISDLHLESSSDPFSQLFVSFVSKLSADDILVLSGDIFELFVGDKEVFKIRYQSALTAISQAGTRGVRIYYIEGNHDFFLKKTFASIPNCSVHDHDLKLSLGDRQFFIAHGDLIDPSDLGYKLLRYAFRSSICKFLVSHLPDSWVDKFGNGMSEKSKKKQATGCCDLKKFSEAQQTIFRDFAKKQFNAGSDYIILGHTHCDDFLELEASGRRGLYLNTGFARKSKRIVSWDTETKSISKPSLDQI